jgi:hypothetical protein
LGKVPQCHKFKLIRALTKDVVEGRKKVFVRELWTDYFGDLMETRSKRESDFLN